jgi:hypothetical protein
MSKKPLSSSAKVIAFLKLQALVDEQALVIKKVRSSAIKKSAPKNRSSKKAS